MVSESDRRSQVEKQLQRLRNADSSSEKGESRVRKSAVFYLGELLSDGYEDPRVTDELIERAKSDPSDSVRAFAVWSLMTAGDTVPESLIFSVVSDEAVAVRIAAADLLGSMVDADHLESLRQLAEDADPIVRRHAVNAFPAEAKCTKFLVDRLQDSSKGVRRAVLNRLEASGDQNIAAALSQASDALGWRERRRALRIAQALADTN